MTLHSLFRTTHFLLALGLSALVACGGAETDTGESTDDALTIRTVNYLPDYEGVIGEPITVGVEEVPGGGGGLIGVAATYECAGGTGVCNTTTFGQVCTTNGGTLGTATCSAGLCDTCACGDKKACNEKVGAVPGAQEQRK